MVQSLGIDKSCSVARASEVIGERWMLLIAKEAMMGTVYFEDFLQNLGIARNILSDRLKKLVKHKVLETVPCESDSRRKQYVLTDKGRALLPVVVAAMHWADQWEGKSKPTIEIVESRSGKKVPQVAIRTVRGKALDYNDVSFIPGPGSSKKLRARFG